jgi:hypothetical protein
MRTYAVTMKDGYCMEVEAPDPDEAMSRAIVDAVGRVSEWLGTPQFKHQAIHVQSVVLVEI